MQIDGTAALVTGGASGLGEATVRALTARGAVCTIFDRDAERAESLASSLGESTKVATGDVGDPEAVTEAVAQANGGGTLRIVVNCAGIGWAQRTIDREGALHDLEAFKTVVNVNLVGTFNVMRIAAGAISKAPPLDDGERGVIVNTASVAAYEGQIGQIAYSASKGGIVAMTVPAARDLAPTGIRVNTIAPGLMDTPLLGLLPQESRLALGAGVLFPKRLGSPEEYASLVIAICENHYLNGETIRLDGGLRMPPK
ncbi:MAG: SDR family NAD(P)-dependent oxidoreductase [Acidimicrobiales bacterium]